MPELTHDAHTIALCILPPEARKHKEARLPNILVNFTATNDVFFILPKTEDFQEDLKPILISVSKHI